MRVLKEKRILIAALDWGMGHATRCVPIIRRLQNQGYEVILASAGSAKKFFESYFPELTVIEKPAYNITYSSKSSMTARMLQLIPSIIRTIYLEHRWLKKVIRQYKISEVISDNCYGLWNKKIHSTFMTHQLRVKCPEKLKFLEYYLHRIVLYFISKYDECYIPDVEGPKNYSGSLSHIEKLPANAKFIGLQSRFQEKTAHASTPKFDLVILLSGPEPQRTILENKCLNQLKETDVKVCIIRGKPGSEAMINIRENITWHNHLPDNELKSVLQSAKKVVCRSGYSTIMDLVALNVKALLVPTPGQTEQEYLAQHNCKWRSGLFVMMSQEDLTLSYSQPEQSQIKIRREPLATII